jgi:EmrB/QacA subfamily drug resistance transporter
MTALFLFTAASLGCGLSWSLESLITFRVLQGVGGGMLTPVGTAMLFRAFPPHERAKASAVLMIPMVVAPASGPVLGGYLVEYVDWRMIFLINIPVGILGFVFAGLFLKEEKQPAPGRFDVPGLLLAASGFATLMYALAEAGSNGLGDARVLAFGGVGLVLLTIFTIVEFRTEEPMIQMRLFRDKLFATANVVQMIGFAGLMGGLFLLPLMLQAPATRHLGAFDSGLATFPQAIGVVMMVQFAGRIYPRIGPRRLLLVGLTGVTITTAAFCFVNLGTSLWWVRGIMFTRGCFFSFMLVSLQTATFATISPALMGRASAINSAGRQVGASFGVALLATVLTNRLSAHATSLNPGADAGAAMRSFHEAFIVASVLTIIGAAAALLISDKDAAVTMRRSEITIEESEESAAGLPMPAH